MKDKSTFQRKFQINCLTKNSKAMKRLISLFAAVIFMTGMVMAQSGNQAYVTQVGANDTSNVTQHGSNNYAEFGVTGDDNYFEGTQNNLEKEGVGNDMKVDQLNWYDNQNYGNRVKATQTGDYNNLDALLKGDENNITFKQQGWGNSIEGFGWSPVSTFAEEPFIYEGDRSMIHIEQVGANNVVKGDIRASNQNVNVYQESGNEVDDNLSEIYIRGSLGSPAEQKVTVNQYGENYSDVDIWGNGNTVSHEQYGGDPDGPNIGKNKAQTVIYGSGNSSEIEQEGSTDMGSEYGNEAVHMIGQEGGWVSGNEAHTVQDGFDNWAKVEQYSNGNTARQVQDAWNGIEGTKDDNQEADKNWSHIKQWGGTDNTAETYQFGDENWAEVMQDGMGNTSITDQGIWDQERPGATGLTPSHGNNNWLKVNQTGNYNTSHVIQNGNSNSATVTQMNP
jgi:hypothetical protein